MDNVFSMIIEMSFKASVVIVFVLLARLLLSKAPKKFSYMLWSVAAFRLCVPKSFGSMFSIFNIGNSNNTEIKDIGEFSAVIDDTNEVINDTSAEISQIIMDHSMSDSADVIGTITDSSAIVNDSVAEGFNEVAQNVTEENIVEIGQQIDWAVIIPQILTAVWLIGMAALLIYGIISYIKVCGRMQTAILIDKNIYYSDRIDSPFTIGFIKPKIYLPFGLSEEEQACIIAHEKCHIRRFDHFVKAFSFILLAVYWFNPLCWIAFNRMSYDMEMSCDEMVLNKALNDNLKKLYSKTLLSIGSLKRFPTPSPITFAGISNTKKRITHVLGFKKPNFWMKTACYAICFVVMFTCAGDVMSEAIDEFNNDDALAAYNRYISGEIPVKDGEDEFYRGEIDKFAYYDINGDGIAELHTNGEAYNIFGYENGNVVSLYEEESGMNASYILDNGALFSYISGEDMVYRYTVIDGEGNAETVEFGETNIYPEDEVSVCTYHFNNETVTKAEYNELTEEYIQASRNKAVLNWIEVGRNDVANSSNHFHIYKSTDIDISLIWYYSENSVITNCYENNKFTGYKVVDYDGNIISDAWHYLNESNSSYIANSFEGYEDYVFVGQNGQLLNYVEDNSSNKFAYVEGNRPALVNASNEVSVYLPNGVIDAYQQECGVIIAKYSEAKYENDVYRLLDSKGNILNERAFGDIGTFANGMATVVSPKEDFEYGKIGLIDIYGNILIEPNLGQANSAPDIYDGKIAFIGNDGDSIYNNGRLCFANVNAKIGKPKLNNDLKVEIKNAEDMTIRSGDSFVYHLDESGLNSDWTIVFTVSETVTDFKFWSLDESEVLTTNEVLFESDELTSGKPFMASTYIDGATINRGFSLVDGNGKTRFYAIVYSGYDGKLTLEEVEVK